MSPDRLSATFAALADPTRRAILARLALGESSVTELARPFEMSLPAVSKHLKVLAEVGLVRMRAAGRNRLYRLDAPALAPLQRWLATYEQLINARYDRLDDYLAELQAEGAVTEPEQSASKKGTPS